jgi:hypothetical protein
MIKLLDFLNLLDSDKRISLTNVGLVVLVAKLAFSGCNDLTAIAGVIAGFSNYAHKRSTIASASKEIPDETKR